MRFEFDREKSVRNKQKHGVTLAEAVQLWRQAHLEIRARTADEPRFMVIGVMRGKLYACIYTTRGDAIRLISCRRVRLKEVRFYHAYFPETTGQGEAHSG